MRRSRASARSTAEDLTDTIAAVVRGEPDWTALPADVPSQVRAIIKRCLEKDRKARIPDIAVVRFLLDDPPASAATIAPPVAEGPPLWKRAIPIAPTAIAELKQRVPVK